MPRRDSNTALVPRGGTLPAKLAGHHSEDASQAKAETRRRWPARMPVFVGLLATLLLVGGFGGWAVFSSLAGAIVASGRVEVEQNRQVVQHLDGGVVAQILVEEGDTIVAGDILLELDSTTLRSELSIVESQLFEVLSRRARLEAERDEDDTFTVDQELTELAATNTEIADLIEGQKRLFAARREGVSRERAQLAKQRDQISDQVRGLNAQTAALSEQIALIGEELKNQESLLERGLAQSSRVLSLQREAARLKGNVGELTAQMAQAEGRIIESELESLKLAGTVREEAISQLRDLRVQEHELRERRLSLKDRLSRLSITAPVSGVIYGLTVNTPRSVLRPAEPVLYIVPQDRPLVIAAQVPPIHIDQVYAGQKVNLRFSALDQRRTPELSGQVVHVSPDSFTDEARGTSYYRAEIILAEGEIDKLPEGSVLIPGMPAEAYILTSERSPLDYLIKPFSDYFEGAFRD
ncbi:HlyD family type I secretion periplasmic adaptor subunit [Lentibacter algarum]|nr:HlyD family type I secretion periplasmic adaptor subunit [Lentibacter algarum]